MITVWTNGCFDVLHYGHFQLLRRAREFGNRLVVGINADETITRLKGPTRPIHTLQQRYEQLRANRYVDEVIVFLDDTPCKWIEALRPQIVVKGPGYNRYNMPEAAIVDAYGGRIVFLDGPELSTTRILELESQP